MLEGDLTGGDSLGSSGRAELATIATATAHRVLVPIAEVVLRDGNTFPPPDDQPVH